MTAPQPIQTQPVVPARRAPLASLLHNRDDVAYILPMAVFLLFTQVGVWWPNLFPVVYGVKTILTAILLFLLWPFYTRIRWNYAWLGVVVGVIGVVQWVGMEKLLLRAHYPHMSAEVLDPYQQIQSPAWRLAFFAVRWLGPTLVVPFMEELFWRDFLWRTLIAPNDFKLAEVGEWDLTAFFVVPIVFAGVHIQWVTAIVWALMIGVLLVRTKSLGACIIAHGVTNFLLGAYVLWTHDWYFW